MFSLPARLQEKHQKRLSLALARALNEQMYNERNHQPGGERAHYIHHPRPQRNQSQANYNFNV
jgi:hypothetical protein